MLARPPHRGETSATIWGVGSRHVSPSPPEHRVMGRTWPCPPPREIPRQRTRCQSYRKDEEQAPQHTPIQAKRSTLTARHSRRSNLVGWHVATSHCHTVSYEINTPPLQYALNRLNILLIHTSNTNATVNLAVTVLNNFKLKRDTIQTKNDLPTQ